jgi:peptidoglycan/LPS O-acetylase OafA/YrhL
VSDPFFLVRISSFTSWFLDLLRVVAAVGVVLSHLGTTKLAPGVAWLQPFGHLMVVCFFVLSGFLIAASVSGKNVGGARYAALRLGRLWSVAIPCLLVTLLLQLLAENLAPAQFSAFERGHPLLRYGLVAFFLNEVWFSSAGMAFNSPVWSLAYEAWYYALFGVVVFVRNPVWRIGLLAGLALVAGPKILLLFPIWLLGVGLWKVFQWRASLRAWAWPVLVLSVTTIMSWIAVHPRWPAAVGHEPWFFSAAWASDFVFGLAIAGLILGVDLIWGVRKPAPAIDATVRAAANVSFTLYLLHFPLMAFTAMVLPYDRASGWHVGAILVGIFAVVFAFGSWIEPQRKAWTAKIEAAIRALRSRRRVMLIKLLPRVRT